MTTIPQLATVLQTVFGVAADAEAKPTGFVQRRSKLTGAVFVQTLVFGWLECAQATLQDLAQTALAFGVAITPQGLEQRFTEAAASLLKHVLDRAIQQVIASAPAAIPVFQRFSGVYILDSSTITLPGILASIWSGCGNRVQGSESALKIHVRLEAITGSLDGPVLSNGRLHDRSCSLQSAPLPAGALRLADLGYFSLETMRDLSAQHVYWLSRLQTNTVVFDSNGQRCILSEMLSLQGATVDSPVTLGLRERLSCRLVAVRVPDAVCEQRRRRMKDQARRRQQPVTQERLRLAAWTIYVTNTPPSLLSAAEAMVVGRVRWQIELLIKLWKSHGHIDESRSSKQWRILCEIYAKLLAMLVQHWLLLVSCWPYVDRSLVKAAKIIQKHVRHLEIMFHRDLASALDALCQCLTKGCRINKSKRDPRTFQLLLRLA
jgi:hypothetical protein